MTPSRTAFLFALLFATTLVHAGSVDERIAELRQFIGGYPPHFSSEADHQAVLKKYKKLKQELDAAISAHPENDELLYERGSLQAMAHNMDYPGAWKGADADLRKLLQRNPAHLDGTLELGSLYVNSDPRLAPQAEKLFLAAQCISRSTPNEPAQRGLFFAYTYQGEMEAAYRQALLLAKLWPNVGDYRKLADIAATNLRKMGRSAPEIPPKDLKIAPCDDAGSGTEARPAQGL